MIARISCRIATGAKSLLNSSGGLSAVLLAVSGAALSEGPSIDQTRAMAGWVTPGDAPGFPVTITAPGRYKLNSDLIVPAGTGGIVIQADDVQLDLNGFAILGPAKCTANESCPESAAGIAQPESHYGALIANGSVDGFRIGIEFKGEGNRTEYLTAGTRIAFVPGGDGIAEATQDETAELAWGKPRRPAADGGAEIEAGLRAPANAIGSFSL